MKKFLVVLVLAFLTIPRPVSAQEGVNASLSDIQLGQFPSVQAYLDLAYPDGSFINGLTRDSVSILEDGVTIPLGTLSEERIGLQISVVINAGPAFALRNSLGVSRFDYLVQYLNDWAERQKEVDLDDLSLLTNSGIRQLHLKDVLTWQTGFLTYRPDLRNSKPQADLLGQAADIALDRVSDAKVERAILYLTPLPEAPMGQALKDAISRAKQAGAHVFVWMIASAEQFTDPRAEELRQLANQTGGSFIAFSGKEQMPPIQTLLEPLRSIYQLSYRSRINSTGQHNLAAQVVLSQQIVTTDPVGVQLTILPPNAIFMDPPVQILRSSADPRQTGEESLVPQTQLVEILMEFPDGHPRSLTASTLLVDGKPAVVNQQAPFERFTWDIRALTSDGLHWLQVQVTDELGLKSTSRELPVEIVVVHPAINRWADFMNGGGVYLLLLLIFILGAGSVITYNRVRAARQLRGGKTSRPVEPARAPLRSTQPSASSRARATGRSRGEMLETTASLVVASHDLISSIAYDIPLGGRKFTIGSDRFLADVVLNLEGVAARHTVIWRDPAGTYHAASAVLEAVTLVNGQPAGSEGLPLHPEDRVEIGPVTYRYHEVPVHGPSEGHPA